MLNRSTWFVAAASCCIFAGSMTAEANAVTTPELSPPPGATVVREVQAGGAQVYACRAEAAGAFAWTLVGPKAVLVNEDGSDFGTHSAGPTWVATDGSSIVADGAHPLAKGERPDSVPALLLAVKSSSGSGILTPVRFVRRSDTDGGLPPQTGCDAAHADTTIARHYSAVYTFYQ
jgi:hypothetical protein